VAPLLGRGIQSVGKGVGGLGRRGLQGAASVRRSVAQAAAARREKAKASAGNGKSSDKGSGKSGKGKGSGTAGAAASASSPTTSDDVELNEKTGI
jgi:Flp pilus assembly protein TadG